MDKTSCLCKNRSVDNKAELKTCRQNEQNEPQSNQSAKSGRASISCSIGGSGRNSLVNISVTSHERVKKDLLVITTNVSVFDCNTGIP